MFSFFVISVCKPLLRATRALQGIWLCCCMLVLLNVSVALAQPVTGVVYVDDNVNGLRDPSELGVADVLVSNGRDIVRTDAMGRYQIKLASADDSMIFVIKPRDYALPVDRQQIPRFWYQHDPNGAPTRRYAGSPPTGELPQSVDFALIAKVEPDHFRVALIADSQVKDNDEIEYYRRDLISSLQRHKDISLGFTLGDVVHDNLDLYPAVNETVAALNTPWFNIMGNHDMNLDALDDLGSDDTYQSFYGPTTYALQYASVHFIYFDNVIHWLNAEGEARYHGGLRGDQLTFVRNYLALVSHDDWVVLLMHIPLVDPVGDNAIHKTDLNQLNALLAPFPKTLSVSGHVHQQQHFYLTTAEGWQGTQPHYHYNLGAASGSWWSGDLDAEGIPDATMQDGTPNGYSVIEFTPETFKIDYFGARLPLDERLRILGPGPVVYGSYPSADVYVNVFNGEANDIVEYRVDQEPWQILTRTQEKDPYVLVQNHRRLLSELPPSNDRLSAALPSTHLWKARIATHYAPGQHRIQVRTKDRYGREFSAVSEFSVVELEPFH